ncbi:hypothetical protein AVEN_205243-1 [Araneus ventricosus]|uniref:Uncharacterized protein n=1 Tax=Araneus ventricosus TaxID=182803 RepID=A0A4Y2FBR4_ARAVE|nr:hypothetical protein AVEN_205243-1 [Araneus ventricosus]
MSLRGSVKGYTQAVPIRCRDPLISFGWHFKMRQSQSPKEMGGLQGQAETCCFRTCSEAYMVQELAMDPVVFLLAGLSRNSISEIKGL